VRGTPELRGLNSIANARVWARNQPFLNAVWLLSAQAARRDERIPARGALQNYWLRQRLENRFRRWNQSFHPGWAGNGMACDGACSVPAFSNLWTESRLMPE
jgi:hypothetical protein